MSTAINTETSITFERESKFAINVVVDGNHVGQIETDPLQGVWVDVDSNGLRIDRSADSVESAKKAICRVFS